MYSRQVDKNVLILTISIDIISSIAKVYVTTLRRLYIEAKANITRVTLYPRTLASVFRWFTRYFKQRLSYTLSPKRYISPIKTFNLGHFYI